MFAKLPANQLLLCFTPLLNQINLARREGLATPQTFGLLRYAHPFRSPRGPLQNSKLISGLYKSLFFIVITLCSNKFGSINNNEKGFDFHRSPEINFEFCGERGIRTPGPVKINGFQDRRIRPLCHLSRRKSITNFAFYQILRAFLLHQNTQIANFQRKTL